MLVLNAYQFEHQIWVRRKEQVIACYRAHPTQKYPYIYPVAGPATGLSLTTESGALYPHHRSLLFACDRINGGNFWQEGVDRGRIVSRSPRLETGEADQIILTDACDWRLPGEPAILTDQRRFTFTMPSEGLLFIDAEITLTAVEDAHVNKTNHSLFALRSALDICPAGGGHLINADGKKGESETFGEISPWCDFYGERGGVTEGIALLDHPSNPWTSRWFTRDYGFCSPTPVFWLGDEGYDLGKGESIRTRYRVIAHIGTPSEANIQRIYEEWAR